MDDGRQRQGKGILEEFPDLTKLDDDGLKAMIEKLEEEESELSYQRRILHGKIDILRAELVARMKTGQGEFAQVDVDRLSEILAGKASPDAGA
jgi:hypothetical protein